MTLDATRAILLQAARRYTRAYDDDASRAELDPREDALARAALAYAEACHACYGVSK